MANLTPEQRQLARDLMNALSGLFRFSDANVLRMFGKLLSLPADATCRQIFMALFHNSVEGCGSSGESNIFESQLMQTLADFPTGNQTSVGAVFWGSGSEGLK